MGSMSSSQALPSGLAVGSPEFRTGWAQVTSVLIVGYLCVSRSFAYLGLPWIDLYVGEIVLIALLLVGPMTKQGRWVRVALRVRRLKRLERLLMLFLCYGAMEAVRGMLKGHPVFTAARDTAFNYYSFYVFLGIWAGLSDRDLLRRAVRILAWWNGCYGLAYVLLLSRLPLTMPGTANAASTVPLFSEPYGSGIALLGLLAFEPKLRKVWHLLALNALVMLWVQVRAEWVGFAVGLILFAWCTKRIKPLAIAAALAVVLLGFMYVARVDLPSPSGRGGRISVNDIISRAAAPVNKDLASRLAPQSEADFFAVTADWRLLWWAGIWTQIHTSVSSELLGLGYGYPVGDLNPMIDPGTFIQTPHSVFFYALGFTGWVGVVLFTLVQLEFLRLLIASYRKTGQPFGLMCWGAFMASSLFEEIFEGPFGAIPFYLLIGIALAPALLSKRGGTRVAHQVTSGQRGGVPGQVANVLRLPQSNEGSDE